MRTTTRFVLLFLAPVMLWGLPQVNLHINFEVLREMDAASSARLEDLSDAGAYVKKSAVLCRVASPAPMPEYLMNRLAAAEFDAVRNPARLVTDEQVAAAFNLMSDEFSVRHPVRLTASDVLEYRSVQASIFPHLFSPKTVGGSRPIGTIIMLYQLWYNGGVTENLKRAAQLDRPPGSLKVVSGRIFGRVPAGSGIGTEYRSAGRAYFQGQSLGEIQSFMSRLVDVIAPPDGAIDER
jgi:hypothetical protein